MNVFWSNKNKHKNQNYIVIDSKYKWEQTYSIQIRILELLPKLIQEWDISI